MIFKDIRYWHLFSFLNENNNILVSLGRRNKNLCLCYKKVFTVWNLFLSFFFFPNIFFFEEYCYMDTFIQIWTNKKIWSTVGQWNTAACLRLYIHISTWSPSSVNNRSLFWMPRPLLDMVKGYSKAIWTKKKKKIIAFTAQQPNAGKNSEDKESWKNKY